MRVWPHWRDTGHILAQQLGNSLTSYYLECYYLEISNVSMTKTSADTLMCHQPLKKITSHSWQGDNICPLPT